MTPAQAADPTPVVFVPGGVNPAAITYGELLAVLKETVHPVLKDHELYAGDAPPPGWGLSFEVEAIRRAADAARFGTFHLVGYSGGGAISLAFVLAHGDRLRSLTLIEPAWIGKAGWTPEEARYWAQEERTMGLPMEDLMREFVKLALKPGVSAPAPPPGPPPPWMMKRPAGLRAFMAAFRAGDLDHARLRRFARPVYAAYGDQSSVVEGIKAKRLAGIFPDCRVEIYEGTHHFAPPQRLQPDRFARALRDMWARGDVALKTP